MKLSKLLNPWKALEDQTRLNEAGLALLESQERQIKALLVISGKAFEANKKLSRKVMELTGYMDELGINYQPGESEIL